MKLEKLLWTLLVLVVMLGFEGCEKEEGSGDPFSRAGLLPEDTEEYNEEINYILRNLKCAPKPVAGMKDDILGKWQVVRGWYSPLLPVEKPDRSCDGIIYEFLPGNRVIVTGDDTHPLAGENEYCYCIYEGLDSESFATSGANLYINDKLFLAIPYSKHMDLIETIHYDISEKLIRIK